MPQGDLTMIEVDWEDGARQLDDCDYLFALSIREIEELTLEVMLTEANAQEPVTKVRDDSPFENLLIGARPIARDPSCRLFRLTFGQKHMISYTVLNESYGRYPVPPEQFTGKLFRVFSWSHLLELTRRTTYACDEYPGKLHHYSIACQNHIIDVICTGPPSISVGSSPS